VKGRYVFLCVTAVAMFALLGGFAIGQESVQSSALFPNSRLYAALDGRTGADVDLHTLPIGAAYINGVDHDLDVRVPSHTVVKVFAFCDPEIRPAILKNPVYHQGPIARYCAERKPSK